MKKRASLRIAINLAFAIAPAAQIPPSASTQSKTERRKDWQNTNTATNGAGCETVHDRFSNRTTVSMPQRVIFRSESPREELSFTVNLASSENTTTGERREVELVFV